MMEFVKKSRQILSRYYLRYLVSTELYMVEPWERIVMHVIFAVFFGLFWYFNQSVIVNTISNMRDAARQKASLV